MFAASSMVDRRAPFFRYQLNRCKARDLCRRFFRKREHGADIDLVKHVGVPARCVARSVEKVSQMIGSDPKSIPSTCIIWGVHSDSIFILGA
jgi:hypothetical protein